MEGAGERGEWVDEGAQKTHKKYLNHVCRHHHSYYFYQGGERGWPVKQLCVGEGG